MTEAKSPLADRIAASVLEAARHQYINGQWVEGESGRFIDVLNPATEESIAQVPEGTSAEVERAARAARAAFESWAATSVEERLRLLEAIQEQLSARSEEIAAAISAEMGSPATEAGPVQVGLPMMTFKVVAEVLSSYQFETDLNGASIVREPIGVVGAITPWNFPLHQVALKVAPAIATGCTIVVKPSELAPLSTVIFADILDSVGLPAGVFNLVQGYGPEVGEAIASHPEIDMVSFTGSTRAGQRVSELAARTVKRVAVELGGKSPNIVLADADFEAAIAGGVDDCYFNGGQTCSARTRMLVPRDRMAEAAEIAKRRAESYILGSAEDEGANLGPMVSASQRDKVIAMISTGIEEGAKLVTGGTDSPREHDKGYFVKPTVFSEVDPDMTIAREEIFGPVLSIIGYDSEDEAVQIANDSIYGLAGAVWSSSEEHARAIAHRMRTGQVYINGAALNFYAPFGGYKQSGNGREWGPMGFEEYLETKAII
ncbi:aldehyde dehydrogenase family protein [Gordonia terrae]|uniref:aldehyde dehydrogenase (NAD(+)) n=1 Tax=Gordonia terrae TaxID=2055 RepID=A0A2I1R4T5_9ACTN|nr:aldehyde dehydrogenase family protein [Gordonia terrae]PKZ64134.1 aldehyde dehydrogenase family protein [Gordonia terrae]